MDYTSPPCLDQQECHLNLPCYPLIFSKDSWVSPVTYNPASGLYIQTFPLEHHKFLQKYGQYIEVPDYPNSSWVIWNMSNLKHATSTLHKVSPCQVWEIYGGNSGNSGRQVWTYEMSEGTSASAYVLHPFRLLSQDFRMREAEYWIGGSE